MPEAAAIGAPPATAPSTPTITLPSKPNLPVHQPTPDIDMASTRETGRKMFRQKLEERFGPTPKPEKVPKTKEQTPPPETPKTPKTDAETVTPDTETPETPAEKPAEGQTDQTPPTEPTDKGKKVSPWKIVEQYKERTKSLEKELAEVKASIKPENDVRSMQTELEQLRTSLKEKEDYLRLHHYQQSDEFRTKFEQPWEQTWLKTAKQMQEITVTDPTTGAERQATVHDIERLVNSPLGAARKMADEMFGPFANDAMAMRGKIVELFEAREEAIAKAKTEGANWQKTQSENATKQTAALRQEIAQTWQKSNETYLADEKVGHYFKPHEGDQEWNDALQRGFKLVDEAFAGNIMDPKLEAEQRASMVRKHAAVRYRAAAFGGMRKLLSRMEAKVAALEEELGKYRGTTPKAGEVTKPSSGTVGVKSGFSGLEERLRQKARAA